MSHEIRTPLNGVLGMNELLLHSELTAQQKIWAEAVHLSGHHLLNVINDILDFSKIESGHMILESVDFNLVDLVEDAVTMFAQQAKNKDLELATQFTPPNTPIYICGDPFRFRQIVINLINNAIKFTQYGEVVVRITVLEEMETNTHFQLCVEDTGIGIAKEAYQKVFEHFSQADTQTTRQFGGTGLGLAICKHLVELMHGKIWVESVLGKGSKFFIDLSFPKARQIWTTRPTAEAFKDVRVLIVDDNQTNREILLGQLKNWKMCIHSASCGEEALNLMNQAVEAGKPFQLVILDMHMPGMDGLQLARNIKSQPQLANTQLMMLTSTFTNGDQLTQQETGILRCISKPIRQSDLFNVINSILIPSPLKKSMEETPLNPITLMQGAILLAEDNPVNQQVARAMLEKLGLQTVLAVNGQEAVDLAKKGHFDLILMDVQMPIMDGYRATTLIRQCADNLQHIPIIALTANAMSGDRQKCLDAGMNDFLSKPFTLVQLKSILERWLTVSRNSNNTSKTLTGSDKENIPAGKPILNLDKLDSLRQLDPEGGTGFLKKLASIYLSSAPSYLSQIEKAIQTRDDHALRKAAHTFKSSAANIGAETLSGLCQKLEDYGENHQIDEASRLLAEMQHEFRQVTIALEELLLKL